ncbi:uncharacterized protein LOC6733430 [Drosophila simulans]|uniref:GD10508 n=1 Tax=Drosophila simulans TaxID=7240 RepID=B4QES6_DROSI|nr:uncharacterized protein LOC6733430 [Drosophila simulans]EDX06072.1 GD10508 [Drosophila simulans]KMY92090.1 uncharacterized protein Dsimw501_GD10508 [Drosophila simulans]
MWGLDTKGGIICSGCLSIAFAITYLALMDDYFWRNGLYEMGMHFSSLQILASLVLIVGAIKQKHKFFVPWMISTGFFLYLMMYLLISLIVQGTGWIFGPLMVVPFSAYLCCALYSVQKAFDRMRKEEPPAYASLSDKKEFINHI